MRTAKTLIRLDGCPGRSESLLGAHAILLVLSCGGSITKFPVHKNIFRLNSYLSTDFQTCGPGFVLIFCVALWFLLLALSYWVLPCSLFSCFLSPVYHCDYLAWGRPSWSMCFSCYCFFILPALNFVLFLFLLVSGVCLCHSLDFSVNFFARAF